MKKTTSVGLKKISINRKASFNYFFESIYEAGIVLKGSEIKSIRLGKINIADPYAIESRGEIYLMNSHIPLYKNYTFSLRKWYQWFSSSWNNRGVTNFGP